MMNNQVEGLSTYKAIGLLGRQSIDKLVENGLLVISAREYNNLMADLHAVSAELEVLNKSDWQECKPNNINKLIENLPDVATMTKEQINHELSSYGFTEAQLARMETKIKEMILDYIKSDKNKLSIISNG